MPSPTTGASSWCTYQLETTYGATPIAASAQDLAFVSSAMKPAGEEFASDPSLGGMAPKDPLTKLKRGEGDIEFAMRYEGFDNILHSFFGAIYDEALIEASVAWERYLYPYPGFNEYDKAASILAGKRSLQFDLIVPDGTNYGYRFTGALITSLRFAIQNEALQATASFLAKPPTVLGSDPGAASFPTVPLILGGSTATITLADRGAAGSTFLINDGEVNIEIPKSNDREWVGSFDMQEPVLNGPMVIGITLNRENLDTALFADWNTDQPKELKISWVGPEIPGTASANTYQFELYFPYCLISNVGPDISDNGVNQESITLTPYWDTDTAGRGALDTATTPQPTNVWCRMQNGVASLPIDA